VGGREGGKGEGSCIHTCTAMCGASNRPCSSSRAIVCLFGAACLCRKVVGRWKEGWAREGGAEGGREGEGGNRSRVSAMRQRLHRTQSFRPLLTARWIMHARAGKARRCV